MKNKIGWCSMTFNPVVGCKNNCSYCYARRINNRFKFIEDWNKPEWRENSFNKTFPSKPQRIFVGSMSETAHWEEKWMFQVLKKIRQYPQHIFQFLTKYPEVYLRYKFPENCWLGATVVNNDELYKMDFTCGNRIKFISIEPILEKIDARYIEYMNTGHFFSIIYQKINWVILGSETGNRKGKIIPKKEWIEDIVNCCKENKIPVYLKDSLKEIYPVEIKEFPKIVL